MEELKQELRNLLTMVNGLKEAIDHNFDLFSTAIENTIAKANESPKEPKEYELIPFDIEKAKQGAKVVTRAGHDVRILCYDSKVNEKEPIVTEIYGESNVVSIVTHSEKGRYIGDDAESDYDLMIAEECV